MREREYDEDDRRERRSRRIKWVLLVALILVIGWSVKGALTWHDNWSSWRHAGGWDGEARHAHDGAPYKDVRALTGFRSVTVRGNTRLLLTVGPGASVSLEGPEHAVKALRAEVKDGRLILADAEDGWSWGRKDRVTARVSLPSLEGLEIAGNNSVKLSGAASGDSSITISGATRLTGEGRLDALNLVINGTGHVALEDLTVDEAVVVLNGAGGVNLDVRKSLVATVNGAGHIRYSGDPEQVTSSVHGIGSVKRD